LTLQLVSGVGDTGGVYWGAGPTVFLPLKLALLEHALMKTKLIMLRLIGAKSLIFIIPPERGKIPFSKR